MKKMIAILVVALFSSALCLVPVSASETNGWQTGFPGGGKGYYSNGRLLNNEWAKIDGSWYYFNNTNVAVKGWNLINDNWYCFSDNCILYVNCVTPDGYAVDKNGVMIGKVDTNTVVTTTKSYWNLKTNNKWEYIVNGSPIQGWKYIGNKWYYFDTNKEAVVGWKYIDNYWYYFLSNCSMKTGWLQVKSGDPWYYLLDSGKMVVSRHQIGNKTYCFSKTGEMLTSGVTEDGFQINSDGTLGKYVGGVSESSDSSSASKPTPPSSQVIPQGQEKFYNYIKEWEAGTGYKIKRIYFCSKQNGAYPAGITYCYTNDFGNTAEKFGSYVFYENGGYKYKFDMGNIEQAIYFSATSSDLSNGNYLQIVLD